MEMRFTSSVVTAIRFMLSLIRGNQQHLDFRLRSPCWCNFAFFGKIVPGKITRTRRGEPSAEGVGSWHLERVVEFFYLKQLVAEVRLEGIKLDNMGHSLESDAFWSVIEVQYALHFDTAEGTRPERWLACRTPNCGMTMLRV